MVTSTSGVGSRTFRVISRCTQEIGAFFIFVLGSRARHKNVDILFSIAKEIDALGLDILVAGTSGKSFSTLES